MCGRYASTLPPDLLTATMRAMTDVATNLQPNWNHAPSQQAPVVRWNPSTGLRQIDLLSWGLVPAWTTDPKVAPKPINARSETAGGSGMFRDALARRRCLVPAEAFYEWKTMPDGKQPYSIARQDKAPVVFAGVWERWRGADDAVLRTYAILTTTANATMRPLHERMLVVLEPQSWPEWLGEVETDPTALMRPASSDVLEFWPVSRAVNAVRNNGRALLDRIDDPAAPPPSDAPAARNAA